MIPIEVRQTANHFGEVFGVVFLETLKSLNDKVRPVLPIKVSMT